MWEEIKRFCLLTDEVHAREREKLLQAMKEFDGKEPATEEEFEDLFMLSDLHTQTEHSSNILLKVVIVHLLASFVEFALKEVVDFRVSVIDPPRNRFIGSIHFAAAAEPVATDGISIAELGPASVQGRN